MLMALIRSRDLIACGGVLFAAPLPSRYRLSCTRWTLQFESAF
jgi:hypothetical protein